MSVMHVYPLLEGWTGPVLDPGPTLNDKGGRKIQAIFDGAVATVAIEVSLDGQNWVQLSGLVFSEDAVAVLSGETAWKYIRAQPLNWTSGSVTILLGT